MEIPDLVTQQLGGEEITAAVNLGDEDIVCFTPTRTLVYQGEGLLSDDSLEVYDHDVERLAVSEGRRKTKFTLEYVDRTESFTVPSGRGDQVLERLLAGVLGTAGVLDDEEDIAGVYRFSELTVIITDARVVKLIGSYVWEEDFEEFPFTAVTGLSFEEGSVATQIVLTVDGRPRRIKAPNDEAPLFRQTLTQALLEFHDVQSLSQLNDVLEDEGKKSGDSEDGSGQRSSDIELDESITPLVTGGDADQDEAADQPEQFEDPLESPSGESGAKSTESSGQSTTSSSQSTTNQRPEGDETEQSESAEPATQEPSKTTQNPERHQQAKQHQQREQKRGQKQDRQTHPTGVDKTTDTASSAGVDPEEFEALTKQVERLTTAVKRQNELLTQHHETIEQLVEELKRRE